MRQSIVTRKSFSARWLLVLVILSSRSEILRATNGWEYGARCASELGVELPAINCADGAEVPITRAAGGGYECDRPSFGVSHCNPGSRVLQFTDTIQRNGRTERIVTTAQCRALSGGPNPNFEFAVIQHNETNNKSCWWFPGNGRSFVSPYTANVSSPADREHKRQQSDAQWAYTSTTGCDSCHSSGVYLRSPWIMQVDGSTEGSFVRTGGSGPYTRGGRISFPSRVGRRGFSCAVQPGPTGGRLVRINGRAFDAYLRSQGRPRPANTAPSDTCTRCHYMGFGGSVCRMAETGLAEHVSNSTLRYPDNRWMPPESDWPEFLRPARGANAEDRRQLERRFLEYYGPAIEATQFCCNSSNENRTATVNGQEINICRGGGTFAQFPNVDRPCEPQVDASTPHETAPTTSPKSSQEVHQR